MTVDVFVADEQDLPVDVSRAGALARHALDSEDVDEEAELSVLFVTNDHMRRLNARFAGEDHATDVLAFPMMEEDEDNVLLGDVVICPAIAEGYARERGHDLTTEIDVLLVHGILHLLGYDHQAERDSARMEARLSEILSSFSSTPV